eukprot:3304537-Prorocentrum_lima.AAC.1
MAAGLARPTFDQQWIGWGISYKCCVGAGGLFSMLVSSRVVLSLVDKLARPTPVLPVQRVGTHIYMWRSG